MAIEVRDLRGLEGPNIYHGQPAVKLQLWSDRNISRAIGDTIKQWTQATGSIIGYLNHDVSEENGGFLITTTFTTPFPNVGERLAEGVVADLQADDDATPGYSHDATLFEVIEERKREEPSLPLLQILVEARTRDLPFLVREDGTIMIGSGSRGFVFDPSGLGVGLTQTIPWEDIGRIPVVAITGTNGKTTTTRLCAFIMAAAGLHVGRTDTDGIIINDETIETGDWAGFGGARRVLSDPTIDIAVLETSRGGILRRGLGFDVCDVSVLTNISDDHLGEFGIDTLADLTNVKAVVVHATKAEGHAVLNADDPYVVGVAATVGAPVMWFSRDAAQPHVQEHLATGGDAVWSDGTAIWVSWHGEQFSIPLSAIPITNNGAALHNVDNVMAATAACLALGVEQTTLIEALGRFESHNNPGRLNTFSAHGVTAVLDYAHNEAGISALLQFGKHVRATTGGKLVMLLGGPGDRPDAQIRQQGYLAGQHSDLLLLHEEERYLRGREIGETTALYRAGAMAAEMAAEQIMTFDNELDALRYALANVCAGDVVLAAAHARRGRMLQELQDWHDTSG